MLIRNSTNPRPMGATGLQSKLFSCLTLIFLISSCVTSVDSAIDINIPAKDDDPYQEIYKKATNQYEVIHNFETKFVINATQLTSEFRKAIAERHKRVYVDPSPVLSESTAKIGFFISVYAANENKEDLRDQNLWSIILKEGSKSKSPILVKKLNHKERWKTYFPAVNLWTNEYLVIFDSPSTGSPSQKLVNQVEKTLVISNADAKVHMTW